MYNLNAKIMNNGIKMRKFSVSAFVRLFGGIMCENSDRRVTHMEWLEEYKEQSRFQIFLKYFIFYKSTTSIRGILH